MANPIFSEPKIIARAEGPWSDLALHTIGWKSFQDLSSQVCEVALKRPVEIYREAQDGGQDAVFLLPEINEEKAGTVQCKHTSEANKHLRASDITAEVENVRELVAAGLAHSYVFMTNMVVDAPVAVAIKRELRGLGVTKPHVLGKHYIVRTIRSSSRLRALVPQVYGLGDLGAILDERVIEQTRVFLESWAPKLERYVTTESHRRAVKAQNEHGVVLLLGNPSAGKSAIGAILSTIFSEGHTVIAVDSPKSFEDAWSPHDQNRFFWIDDAFGPNNLREDYVQDWATIFRKVEAAIRRKNRFLFTSRRYIYEAAKRKLGNRNLGVFTNEQAIVDVGELSQSEREQILYNHINFGGQSQTWRQSTKPFLKDVASVPEFLPGIAERLGDPEFTTQLNVSQKELIRFMKEPTKFLQETIISLDAALQATLMLVYVHGGKLVVTEIDPTAGQLVYDMTGMKPLQITERFEELRGSFLKVSRIEDKPTWSFAHPTIADAFTEILKGKPQQIEALIRGGPVDTILETCVCAGVTGLGEALIIPTELTDVLVSRLLLTPNSISQNSAYLRFLFYRTTDDVFKKIVSADKFVFDRREYEWLKVIYRSSLRVKARAHRLGLLPEAMLKPATDLLTVAALRDFDLSFLEDDDLMSMFGSRELFALGIRIRGEILDSIEDMVSDVRSRAEEDNDPEAIDRLHANLTTLLECIPMVDDDTAELIDDARMNLHSARQDLLTRQSDEEEDDWDSAAIAQEATVPSSDGGDRARSIFDDVDH
ncbi:MULTISPECIES: hypothetical protein [Rhizobium]|uniref:nSTAND3 domain-containing NTPase n=1 Tax=Rhizobium TaxID=379 RepID=UPI00236015C7|nr:hypothetical protein [Rhizobium sp. MC62]MDC9813453.1 hypothetical protein [Rhizobium sp. MC62]